MHLSKFLNVFVITIGRVCWSVRGNMMLQWTQSQLSVWLNYPLAFPPLVLSKIIADEIITNVQIHKLTISRGKVDEEVLVSNFLMCVIFFIFMTFFLSYNIDHSTKNVCGGIFLLKHTIALFVKVESEKNGERTNMQQESVDINIGILIPTTTDIRLLTYRGMRFCCISSLAAAAADDCPTHSSY